MGYLTLTRFTTLLSALLIALAIPATAIASGDDVIRDCAQDGDLDKEYSDEELEDASENLPSDVDSYSNCRDVIRAAQTGGRGGSDGVGSGSGSGGTSGGTGGGSGGSGNESALDGNSGGAGATAEDNKELDIREDAAQNGTAPATDSELLGGADTADDDSGLPTAALVALILLALAGIGGGAYLMRDSLPPSLTSRLPGSSK